MLNQLTLRQAINKLNAKEISLDEIYTDVNKAIADKNKKLNVYLSQNPKAREQAKLQEENPLNGLPIAVKDNFLTTDMPTTASSAVLKGYIPAYESTVTQKLREAGAVIIGKTNMDAWAHGSSTETSDFGRTLNPRNIDYLPGGSSGGSAAAVAANMCLAAIGSETAGSVRGPASACGVVGLKPTYGRVSRYGVIAMASSTDSPGVITKTVEDAAIMLNHMAGHDEKDATTSTREVPDFTASLNQSIKGKKIGFIYHDIEELKEYNQLLETQIKMLEGLGAQVEKVDAMDPKLAISVYTIVQRSEVSSNLSRYTGVRYGEDRSHFGDEAKRRIMLGTFTLSKGYADKYYDTAQKVRTLFAQDFKKLFSKYDALVSLSLPGFARKLGASEESALFGELEDVLMEASSITGLPGISVPCYRDEETNLYLGMNLIAPMWREETVIQIADAFEKSTKWNEWRNEQ